jgi:hypothetical protein
MQRKAMLVLLGLCAVWVAGCPFIVPTPPEAVLAGDWEGTTAEGAPIMFRFDDNGQLLGFVVQGEGGELVLVTPSNSQTTLDGNSVTVSVTGQTTTTTYEATLGVNQNAMTGSVTQTVTVGDDITVVIPQGELTLTRVEEDPCEGVECPEGQTCVDGECVAQDPCEGVECPEGQSCVDGECVAADPCEGVTCDTCQECVDGECVALVGDATAGQTFFGDNGCAGCHGAEAGGGLGPALTGADCSLIFDNLSGADDHPATIEGVTEQDAADLEAWLSSL